MRIEKDVLIIGAGVAGISAAVYLSRSKYSFVLLENNLIGGKLNTITNIENLPGFDFITGFELIDRYQKQLNKNNILVTKDKIKYIKKIENLFEICCDNDIYVCKTIVIATGTSIQKKNIKGEQKYLGKGVSYCAICDGFFYKNKDICVFANENKGYKEALYLSNIVNKIYLINDNNLDDEENNLSKLKSLTNIEFLYPYSLDSYDGDEYLNAVNIINNNDKTKLTLNVDAIFAFTGDTPSSYLFNSLDLDMEKGYIKVNDKQETNIEGIYAAGDICFKPLKQIITASSDGAVAATNIIKYLNSIKIKQ